MLQTIPNSDLIIPVPGTMMIGAVEVQRKLYVVNLQYNIENKNVAIEGIMEFFDMSGNPIQTKLIRNYGVRMQADNTSYCDMQGITICSIEDLQNEEQAAADALANGQEYTKTIAPLLDGKDYMCEFDWFYSLASNQTVIVNQLIQAFFLRGVQEGKFN